MVKRGKETVKMSDEKVTAGVLWVAFLYFAGRNKRMTDNFSVDVAHIR
jgi:hypothetical protein